MDKSFCKQAKIIRYLKPTFQGVINRMPTLYRSSNYDKYTIFLKIKKRNQNKGRKVSFLKKRPFIGGKEWL